MILHLRSIASLSIALALVPALLAQRHDPKKQFPRVLSTVVISPPGVSYVDHEIHPKGGEMVFQSSGRVYVGALDRETGLFANGDGRDIQVDRASSLLQSKNGPEYGIDRHGDAIFYNKTGSAGDVQIWRATRTGRTFSPQLLASGIDRINQLPSQDGLSPTTYVLYARVGVPATIAWFDEATPSAENTITPVVPGFAGFRWARGTTLMTSTVATGPDAGQIVLIDASTGQSRVITTDPGIKFDPFPWFAPELGQLAIATIVDRSDIAIYTDGGDGKYRRITTIPIPASSRMRYAQSPEGFVVDGRSFVSLTLKDDPGSIFTDVGESEIWVYGIDPKRPFTLRSDDGAAGLVRHEAETMEGSGQTFLYYNELLSNGRFTLVLARLQLPR